MGDAPSPEFALVMADEMQRLLDCLTDENLQQIAIGKLEGMTNEELAEQLDCSVRTIERKMARIRQCYADELHKQKTTGRDSDGVAQLE